jgi:hypothetical protein
MKKVLMALSTLGVCMILGNLALAYDGGRFSNDGRARDGDRRERKERRELRTRFELGVCVGQTLAQEGIVLPAPKRGERPKFDEATQKAFREAFKSCREELKRNEPAPNPSASPEPEPSPSIAPAPTGN